MNKYFFALIALFLAIGNNSISYSMRSTTIVPAGTQRAELIALRAQAARLNEKALNLQRQVSADKWAGVQAEYKSLRSEIAQVEERVKRNRRSPAEKTTIWDLLGQAKATLNQLAKNPDFIHHISN